MGIFEQFPYTNFHELNLTWILEALKELEHTINEFVAINALKYADPIQWNITSQYEKNTIVIDPVTGTAYISVQPVPAGVALTNTDYWTVVFDLGAFVVRASKNFAVKYEDATTLTATFPSSVNDWIIWGDVLYEVISPIVAGDQYVVDSNIQHFTIEELVGHLEDLNTTDKSNVVAAINEVLATLITTVGDLNSLNTTDKSNIVSAINEVLAELNDTIDDIYYLNVKDFGAVGDGVTDDTDAVQAAIDAATAKSNILFPAGTYVINGTISVNKSALVLFGTGNKSIITRTIQDNSFLFEVTADPNRILGFEVKSLSFENISDGGVFRLAYVFNSYIHDCYLDTVKNFVTYGDHANTSNMNIWSIVQHIIGNVTVDGSNFIEVDGYTNGIHVYDCQINAELSLTAATFLNCRPYSGIDTIDIERCLVQRFIYCMQFGNNNTADPIQNIFMHNNIFDSNKNFCIIIENNRSGSFITRFNLTANWFNANSEIPIVVTALDGYTTQINITNNFFVQMPTRAILVQGNNAHSINISSNIFNGFDVNGVGQDVYSCITIGGTVDGIIIASNQFTPTADVSAANDYGIYIDSTCTGVVIVGNNLLNITYPVTCNSNDAIITGNYPDNINPIPDYATKYESDILSYYSGGSWSQIPSIMRHVGGKFYDAGSGTWNEITKYEFTAPYTVRWNGADLQYLDSDGVTWVSFTAP